MKTAFSNRNNEPQWWASIDGEKWLPVDRQLTEQDAPRLVELIADRYITGTSLFLMREGALFIE